MTNSAAIPGGESGVGLRGTSSPRGFLLKGPGAMGTMRFDQGASRLHEVIERTDNKSDDDGG
jgi:hypothetical protein